MPKAKPKPPSQDENSMVIALLRDWLEIAEARENGDETGIFVHIQNMAEYRMGDHFKVQVSFQVVEDFALSERFLAARAAREEASHGEAAPTD